MMTLIRHMTNKIVYIQQPLSAMIEGVSAYAHQYTDWQLHAFSDSLIRQRSIDFSNGLAVISDTKSAASIEHLSRLRIPWVNIRTDVSGASCVLADRRANGRLVGEHFSDIGLAAVAVYHGTSSEIHKGFEASCGHTEVFIMPPKKQKKKLKTFLENCPKPLGVFCGSDGAAVECMHFVMELGYRVPEDIAISGTNNNPFQALCAPVPLTSVDPNYFGMAYTAAQLIHRHLESYQAMPPQTLVAPRGLIVRRSTAHVEQGSDVLSQLVQYFIQHLEDGIQIEDALLTYNVSRSSVERYFKQRFKQTPGAWLQKQRLDLAARLLRQEDWDCATIATHCGFNSASYFSRAFKKSYGKSPREWRSAI